MKPLPLIHIVADYGTGDLAFTEVIQRFKYLLPAAEIFPISTPPFSTLNTGFIISQLALHNPNHQLFIFANTAPRKDDSQQRNDNEGEQFKYALLNHGVEVCSVDAGYCFSFIKSQIKDFRLIKAPNKGSQFRSRDYYPQAAVGIINHQHKQYLGKKLSKASIPDIPQNRIMHIDAYGNIKTTIRHSAINLQPGQKIRVVINHIFQTGIYANANFAVKSGDLAFAPGSSGGKNSFMEIFLRSGNASRYFGNPPIETKIKIETF